MNRFFYKVFLKILREVVVLFTKQKTNRVILVVESNSGSNTLAFWKYIKKNYHKNLVNFEIFYDRSHNSLLNYLKKIKFLSSAKVILSTHDSYKFSDNHFHVQLWHGLPLRKGSNKSKLEKAWSNVDTIVSCSDSYNTFLNSLYVTDLSKFKILGFPRNDLLFEKNGLVILNNIYKGGFNKKDKIIFYMPTYRHSYDKLNGNYNYDILFGLSSFKIKEFDTFLNENNFKLIVKSHPHEEELVSNYFSNFNSSNIFSLKNKDLNDFKIDLYELIGSSSMLITDYSSVFYDYLLLEKPILFLPSDFDSYKSRMGFLIENYENWVPGPVVNNQSSLTTEIEKLMSDKSYYHNERIFMKKNIHRYKDSNSSKRLFEFINDILCVE